MGDVVNIVIPYKDVGDFLRELMAPDLSGRKDRSWQGGVAPLCKIMGEETASELYQSGRDAMDRGDFTTAVGHLQRALALLPHYKTMELLGTALREIQRPEEALVYLAAAAGLGNRQFRARYLLAEVLVGLGLTEDAIVKLEEAIELKPDYRAARELLGRIRPARPDTM